jgi:peptide/nickel transport system substrate-binding protein
MNESELRRQIESVRRGTLPRRGFVERLAAFGIGAPMAWLLLADAGVAQPSSAPPYKPTKRGGGGPLRVLLWQAPTLLNPHFATGTKDELGAQVFYDALARFDADGVLQPILAAEIPSRENGGVAGDGRSVIWKLKRGVTWHDGTPFSADDFVFNWQFATDPATAATTLGAFNDMQVERLDSHTVRLVFDRPTPFWPRTYCIVGLIPKHLFGPYLGARSREAPANLKPVGTGPFRFVDFKPGDLLRGEINPHYHQPMRPHFDSIEVKGGGDAVSAARAVLQTGEFDFAWNLQVEDDVLRRMESGGKGRVLVAPGGALEFVELAWHDPYSEVEGERGSARSRHPVWRDAAVREAMALLVDRQGVQDFVYGRAGIATGSVINNPARFCSPNSKFEFNIDKANAVLDGAGWKRGSDGVREKDGRRLRFLFQTSINGARQKAQAIVKHACQRAGMDLELKGVVAAVYFGADVANPDTNAKFWADMQMYTQNMGPPDPGRFMDRYVSWEFATKANKWQGRNVCRWRNDEYDRLFRTAEVELDPVKRVAAFIRMNDLLVSDHYVLPLVYRPQVAGANRNLVLSLSGWANDLSSVHSWYRDG